MASILATLLMIILTTHNTEAPTGLTIRVAGTDAASGLRAMSIVMTNRDNHPHQINGYPAIRVLDKDNNPIPLDVKPGATGITSGFDTPPAPITLQPGHTAVAHIIWRNTVTSPSGYAPTGVYLDLAPTTGAPWQNRWLDQTMDLGNSGTIGITPWTAP